jgi:hypothetical protein
VQCTRCGSSLPEGARFCSSCGASVEGSPIWLRVAGVLSGIVVLVAFVALVLTTEPEDVIGQAVAGTWDCELRYDDLDSDAELSTEWDVEFFEDGRLTVEDSNETAEGSWDYEDGELSVDFGDADLGNPELTTQTIEVDSLDELTIRFERTESDDEDEVGDRTLTCELDS